MTQEEKLEEAKRLYKTANADQKYVLERLFPELKSEDERIRKAIHIYLDWLDGRKDYAPKGEYTIKDMIAWIKKQGEHANFRNKIEIGDKVTRNEDGVLVNLSQLNRVAKKQGEQKPADKIEPKFKVGDIIKSKKNGDTVKVEQILSDSYCYSGWDGAATCYCDFSISEQDNWELVEQKPVENSAKVSESSTEEKDMGEYKKGFECGKQRVLKYPEDFGLCKKSAWSEEDEINLEKAIWYVENPAPMVVKDSMLVEWLKSLKDRYAWKPSKEQIMALRWVLNHIPYDSHKEEISGLLDQIKDL